MDALVLLRLIHEHYVDIEYLLHNPTTKRNCELGRMFAIERAEDDYREMEFVASLRGQSVQEFLAKNPRWKKVEAKRYKARKDPIYSARKSDWPKRWQFISIDEKRKELYGGSSTTSRHVMSNVGNAMAHARPHSLRHFVRVDADGRAKPLAGSAWHGAYRAPTICRFTIVHLLYASYLIGKEFSLPSSFEARALRLLRRFRGPSADFSPTLT